MDELSVKRAATKRNAIERSIDDDYFCQQHECDESVDKDTYFRRCFNFKRTNQIEENHNQTT